MVTIIYDRPQSDCSNCDRKLVLYIKILQKLILCAVLKSFLKYEHNSLNFALLPLM